MWDALQAHPLGRTSMRRFILMVALLVATAFSYLVLSPTAHAAGDVAWKGDSLVYQSNTYTGPLVATGKESFNLPEGTQIYRYIELTTANQTQQKAHFIYFDKGVDVSKATSAKYVEYIYTPPDTYTQPSNQRDVSIDTSTNGSGAESCAVSGGLGWVICPISNTLAGAMDWVYGMLADFMKTPPIQTTQQGTLFQAWNAIRNVANVIFVIAFVIIIYSQLTSLGISNYGLKKLLPRLVIAAILVNVSYYICSIGVDLSNITGGAVHDLMLGVRDNLFNHNSASTNDASMYNWTSIVGFVLSGGTIIGAGLVGLHLAVVAAGGTLTAMIYLILPMLLGFFLAVLVVLLLLAARQAIIVILIVLSPLAFVAYLFPGTEKWFDKWQDLLTTMLIFFPAFSFVFTGAQLAGTIIIQNASSLNMVILGLAVQVAPLAIAPLLLKLSGGVLGKVAGVINNPNKGLLDRTRAWAKERADMHKERGLGEGDLRRRNLMRRYARHHDNRNRYIKERTANYSAMSDNRYNASRYHSEQDMIKRETAEQAQLIEKKLDLKWETHINVDKHALEKSLELHVLGDEIAMQKAQHEKYYEEAKVGQFPMHSNGEEGPQTQSMVDLLNRAQDTTKQIAALGIANQAAKNMQQKMVSEGLSVKLNADGSNQAEYDASQALLKVAAGNVDPNGLTRAQANAEAALSKIDKEARDNTMQLLNIEALKQGTTVKSYTGAIMKALISNSKDMEINGKKVPLGPLSDQEIEAAFEQQAVEGNVWDLEAARGSRHVDQAMLNRVIARNIGTMKSKGGFHLQADPSLSIEALRSDPRNQALSDTEIDALFQQKLAAARIETFATSSAENIADFKVGFFTNVADNLDDIIASARQFALKQQREKAPGDTKDYVEIMEKNLGKMLFNIDSAATNPDMISKMTDRKSELGAMDRILKQNNVEFDTPEAMSERHRETPQNPPQD